MPLRWTAACSWVSAWPLFLQKKELISIRFSCDYPFQFSAVLRNTLQCRLQFPWLFAGSVGQLVEGFPLATDCHSNRPRRRWKETFREKQVSSKLLPTVYSRNTRNTVSYDCFWLNKCDVRELKPWGVRSHDPWSRIKRRYTAFLAMRNEKSCFGEKPCRFPSQDKNFSRGNICFS